MNMHLFRNNTLRVVALVLMSAALGGTVFVQGALAENIDPFNDGSQVE